MGENTAETPVKERKRTIGDAAVEAIKAGKTNQEALEAVKAEFPEAKTTLSSINWYRNKLRADGTEGVKSARELAKDAKAAEAAAKVEEKDPLG